MQIVFTPQEANELIKLLDEAVKAKGLLLAKSGIYFLDKIQGAFKQPEPKQEEVKE